jgi:hypothetical protein
VLVVAPGDDFILGGETCGEHPGPAGRVEGPGLRSPSLVQGAGEESVRRLHRFGNRNPDGCQVAKQQFPNG